MPIGIKAGSGVPIISELAPVPLESVLNVTTAAGAAAAPATAPAAAPAVTPQALEVTWFPQELTNWCWAASAQMILNFHKLTMKQCRVAKTKFPSCPTCNKKQALIICDEGCNEDDVAQIYGKFNLSVDPVVQGALDAGVIREELKNGRPIEVGIQWPKGNGKHLVVVYSSYQNEKGLEVLGVNDPWLGQSPGVLYDSLKSAYSEDKGSWIRTWKNIRP